MGAQPLHGTGAAGKTLGIIGLGKIGRAVARRVAGFEMRVLASDPYLTEEQAAEAGAKLVGMAELLHRSDVITVHTPLTAQTRHLLGRPQLEATKPGAFVLNVARGGIVDESALADALTPATSPAPRWTSTRRSRWRPTTRCAARRTSC